MQANHRYVLAPSSPHRSHPPSISSTIFLLTGHRSFETQLTAVKERLEAAKISSAARNGPFAPGHPLNAANAANPAAIQGGNGFGGFGSRIAKPLRGGGGAPDGGPTFAGLQAAAQQQADDKNSANGKRGSWFFNQRT